MSKVTAIISAYYAEEYIEGRIQNLIDQEQRPNIVIICQNGSAEAAAAAKFGDQVLPILTQDVPTIYAAWNIGIKAAGTEYVTNANSDDRLYPGALAEMADILDKKPHIGAVYPDVDIVEEIGGSPVGRFTWAEGDITKLLRGCFLGPMPVWRRSLHEKHGYFDHEMHIAGDYEMWLRLARAGVKFERVPRPLGAYLKRRNSAEHREKLRAVWETARARGRYK